MWIYKASPLQPEKMANKEIMTCKKVVARKLKLAHTEKVKIAPPIH